MIPMEVSYNYLYGCYLATTGRCILAGWITDAALFHQIIDQWSKSTAGRSTYSRRMKNAQETREGKATMFLIRTRMAIRSQCFSDAVLESPHALVGSCAVAIAINVICPAGSS